jgi:hypothetical protein
MRFVVAGFLLATLSTVMAAPAPGNKYQEMADEMAWDWPKEKASLKYCSKHYKGAFELEMETAVDQRARNTLVKFKDADGKKFFSLLAHSNTVFVEKDNILYYTDFSPYSSGCSLVAYDLQASKELWKTDLKGLGPIEHFKYRNAVVLDIKDGALRVLGNESSGKYVEFVDMKTGKTVGHRVFKDGK